MEAKKKAKSLDDNLVWSGRPDILNHVRPRDDPMPKAVHIVEPTLCQAN